jgi:putative glutamine amidotransferase
MTKRAGLTYSEEERTQPYRAALVAAGVEPVLISPDDPHSLDGLDGLVLSGGIDLNPALYGEARHPEADEPSDARDRLELDLLRAALERDLPVLAICRGMQLFNVAHGGTLDQHVASYRKHQRYDRAKSDPVHNVEVEAGSRLAAAIGAGAVAVNSRHHQAVKEIGQQLVATARDEDGLVEGLERADKKFAVAVQWHPEDQAASDPTQAKLFSAFAEALRS